MVTSVNYRGTGNVDNSESPDDDLGGVDRPPALRAGVWRSDARTGYCEHGMTRCPGWPANGIAPCLPSAHVYCGHGVDSRQVTSAGLPRCPTCRGVTRRERNPDTWRPPRVIPDRSAYAPGHTPGPIRPNAAPRTESAPE